MISTNDFALKRSIRPYLGEFLIIGVITAVLIYASIATSTPSLLGVVAIGLVLAFSTHYADFRYRVYWKNDAVERITSNNITTKIKASEISRISLEKSDLRTMLSLRRPSQRVTIYGRDDQHLDVSLKHFVASDIKRLLQKIHEIRPDLNMPTI